MSSNLPEVPSCLTGGCMCGAVRYEISERPMFGALCHCNRCRPQSGSAFSTVIFIKRSTLRLEGETTVFEDVGASQKEVRGPNTHLARGNVVRIVCPKSLKIGNEN